MPNTWRTSLNQWLDRQAKPRVAVVGIGNTFREDDAAGVLVARALQASRSTADVGTALVIDAGHAPENSTGELRRFAPELVLLVDAADMGELPGTIRWIQMDELDGMSASTHTLPLSMLAKYLTLELGCTVALLGIQPESNGVGETVSPAVQGAVQTVVAELMPLMAQE